MGLFFYLKAQSQKANLKSDNFNVRMDKIGEPHIKCLTQEWHTSR